MKNCEKLRKESNSKMSRAYRRISFVLYFFLYCINFGVQKTNNSRFGVRIVRKSKVKKFQPVDEDNFYDVMSAPAEEGDKVDDGGKLNKRVNGDGKRRAKKFFKRNKVAPAAEKEAWSNTSAKTLRAANKHRCQEISYNESENLVEEDGKMTLKTSRQKWDLKTGKEIKLDIDETRESSSFSTDLSQFLNVLNSPATDNFNICNSEGSSCDLFSTKDYVPGTSGVCVTNEMVVDLTEDNTLEESEKKARRNLHCPTSLMVQPGTQNYQGPQISYLKTQQILLCFNCILRSLFHEDRYTFDVSEQYRLNLVCWVL